MTTRVLVVAGDPVGASMAGPAIRAVELARAVAGGGHHVTLAVPAGSDAPEGGPPTAPYHGDDELVALARDADVIVAFAPLVARHPALARTGAVLVVDAYDPGLLETLERRRGEPVNAQRDWVAAATSQMVEPLRHADAVLVASDRQRHFAIGILAALGRLGPRVLAEDPTLESMVRTVPFGTPARAPEPATRPLTGPQGLAPGAAVALWGGGLYDWLDPVTLVDAVALSTHPSLVAVFLAGRHPTPAVGRAALVDVARDRAAELGVLGTRVIVHEQWVPYAERGDWLRDARIGVSLHHPHLETELAFRTRILDYLWAGLPVVCTGGDVLAELVADRDLGEVVPPGDVRAVAAALDRVLSSPAAEARARSERLALAARELTWERAAAPLLELCDDPTSAPDRRVAEPPPGPVPRLLSGARRLAGAARQRW